MSSTASSSNNNFNIFFFASFKNLWSLFGVLCAEITLTSCMILNFFKVSLQCIIVFQSDLLPMIIPTKLCDLIFINLIKLFFSYFRYFDFLFPTFSFFGLLFYQLFQLHFLYQFVNID